MNPTAYITTALLAALIAWGVRRITRPPDPHGDALDAHYRDLERRGR